MGSTGYSGSGDLIIGGGNIMELPVAGKMYRDDYINGLLQRGNKAQSNNPLTNAPHEEMYIFDKNGTALAGFTGGSGSVSIRGNTLQYEGAEGYHNHPGSFGGTLSLTDLKTFSQSKWSSITAVDAQGRQYTVKAGANANREGLRKWATNQGRVLERNIQNSYKKTVTQATTPLKSGPHKGMAKISVTKRNANGKTVTKTSYIKPMTPAQADKLGRQVATGMFDRAYKKNIAKFGFTYTKKNA